MKKKFRSVLERVNKYWKNADGQDLVEYALLLIFVGLAAVASVKSLSAALKTTFTNANNELLIAGGVNVGASGASIAATQNTGSAAGDNVAAGVNAADSAAEAQAAAKASNFNAGLDLAAAAADLNGNGFTLGAFGAVGGAAYDDAQAALAAAAGNNGLAALDATRANALVTAAGMAEAAATSKGTIFGI